MKIPLTNLELGPLEAFLVHVRLDEAGKEFAYYTLGSPGHFATGAVHSELVENAVNPADIWSIELRHARAKLEEVRSKT